MKYTFRLFFVFLLLCSLLFPLPAQADEVGLSELFRQAVESTETETLPMRLHDAFYADTYSFITLLAQEDMHTQESVCHMVAQHSCGSGEYIQYVLSLLPEYSPQVRGNTLFLLLNVKADFTEVPTDFTETLFTALRHSDGAMSTRCYSLMADLLAADPFGLVAAIAWEDAEFQDSAVTVLAIENYCWDGLTMDDPFHQSLSALNESTSLTDAERSFVDRLTARVEELESECITPTNEPTETATALPPADYYPPAEPVADEDFYDLRDGELSFQLDPSSPERQFTQGIKTNTNKIIIYVEELPENASVTVYIYRDASLQEYFCSAPITAEELVVYVGPLSYAETYFVGLEAENLEQPLTVKITDQELNTTLPGIKDYTPVVIAAVCLAALAAGILIIKRRKQR